MLITGATGCITLTYSLPFADPAVVWFAGPDHPFEVGARAVVDIVAVVPQIEERFAVVATVSLELLHGLREGEQANLRLPKAKKRLCKL